MLPQWTFPTAIIVAIATLISPNLAQTTAPFDVLFGVDKLTIDMNTVDQVNLTISNISVPPGIAYDFRVKSDKEDLAIVDEVIGSGEVDAATKSWKGTFDVQAMFLGNAKVYVELITNGKSVRSPQELDVIIIRETRIIDHVFTGSVALFLSVLYINFGAALDLGTVKEIVRRPVGPCIGFVCQFLIMPVLSFGLGYILFPQSVELHLGLFFTGVSPAGGASNIWTVILQGNINLSIAMTSIGNFAAFGMMPLWIFTLGSIILDRGNLGVPYGSIATFAVSLVVPLGIGILIQKFLPRVGRILVRLLKPVSTVMILFIVIFAILTNLYLFQLFSWKIIVAGLGLPWLGYTFGWIVAKIFSQTPVDAMTIAIETGIQNTGITIFLLRFSLPQPQADLTTVIPVCVAMMSPVPLFLLYIVQRIRQSRRDSETEMYAQKTTACKDDVDPSERSFLG